jgi:hypothetical protein
MKNGIIYTTTKFVLDNLKYLTLVELFKYVGYLLNPKKNNVDWKLAFSRTSVDIFIILKWALILILAKYNIASGFWTFVTWYLILTNVYTYFYYHIWTDEALNTENFSMDRIRRRFVTLMLAVGYSDLCFAYLYKAPFKDNFDWSCNLTTFTKSTWFSISNSLAANYDAVKPITDFGYNVSMTQLILTFVFVTIILSKSIPQTNSTT